MIAFAYDLLSRRVEVVVLRSDDLECTGDVTMRVSIRWSKAGPFGRADCSQFKPSCATGAQLARLAVIDC